MYTWRTYKLYAKRPLVRTGLVPNHSTAIYPRLVRATGEQNRWFQSVWVLLCIMMGWHQFSKVVQAEEGSVSLASIQYVPKLKSKNIKQLL